MRPAGAPRPRGKAEERLLLTAALPCGAADPVAQIATLFGHRPLAQLLLFASPDCDFPAIARAAHRRFPGAATLCCTTAGEIGPEGYAEGQIIAVGLPADRFATRVIAVHPLSRLDAQATADRVVQQRIALWDLHRTKPGGFGFLLVDGLSRREDVLLSAIAPALGPLPLFGGSAGDGRRFGRTLIAIDGVVLEDAAALCLVAGDCEARVFSLDHLTPTAARMVVTAAEPEHRIVQEINAEPAAREYARIIGKDPDRLDEFTFAAHPVVVRLGDTHHVRAIQRVTATGALVFYSAVDEGMVLSVAVPGDMPRHLDARLAALARERPPSDILACDCLLRRIEAEERQSGRAVSEVLARHRVVGFSTYGEQIGPMHVNQTMTGVALYPPEGS